MEPRDDHERTKEASRISRRPSISSTFRRLNRISPDKAPWEEYSTTRLTERRKKFVTGENNRTSAIFQERAADRTSRRGSQIVAQEGTERASSLQTTLSKNILLIFVLLSILVGFFLGTILRQDEPWSERQITLLRLPGELMLRCLHCLSVPLIMTSVTGAVGSWRPRQMAKLAAHALSYATVSTVCATLTGACLALLIRPGGRGNRPPFNPLAAPGTLPANIRQMNAEDVLDTIRNLVPGNIPEAFLFMTQTNWYVANSTAEEKPEKLLGTNVLGLVAFSVMVGVSIVHQSNARNSILLRIIFVLSNKFMRMADIVLRYSPVGICFLIAAEVVRFRNFHLVVWHLGVFVFTVLLGLGVHALLFLPALYMLYIRRNTKRFFLNIIYPLSVAFGTSSSLVACPVSMSVLRTRIGMSRTVVHFMLPFGTLFNNDGTALYEVVSVIFIAQLRGADMGLGTVIVVCTATLLLSFGAYGVHPAYRATTHATFLLTLAGLHGEDIRLITSTHWILSRFAAAVDLLSDCTAVAVLQSIHVREKDKDSRPGYSARTNQTQEESNMKADLATDHRKDTPTNYSPVQ
ncbi:excitatory amino acid transporter-like [Ornithodoros turicata]|uniref:excitatory amino acid transporter-like n=1 Tax=Ornithodoros turicata TaxID=34597 RepID=UPI0031390746